MVCECSFYRNSLEKRKKVLELFNRSSFLAVLNMTVQLQGLSVGNNSRAEREGRERSITVFKGENKIKQEMLLVEFKVPRELVEAFDNNWALKFSSRSETVRFRLRTFLEAVN